MKPEDFDFVAKTVKERSGLVLTKDKAYLLESRLMPLARKRGLNGLEDVVEKLRKKDESLIREVVEAMTTNESFFFRDQKPFEQFENVVLPHLLKARANKKHIRIWCAAASSGQEPYSLGIILKENQSKVQGWKIDIIGTDLSEEIIQKAKAGTYSQFEVQRGLPSKYLVKYFKKKDEMWQIDPSIRGMVEFRVHNLLENVSQLGTFDVVFCRNVLIYFDQDTKAQVLERIAKQMPSDGFLYLGGAETVLGVSDKFKPIPGHRGIYGLAQAPTSAKEI